MKTLRRFPEKRDLINIANNLSDLRSSIVKEIDIDNFSFIIKVYQNGKNGKITIVSDDLKQLLGNTLVNEMFTTPMRTVCIIGLPIPSDSKIRGAK